MPLIPPEIIMGKKPKKPSGQLQKARQEIGEKIIQATQLPAEQREIRLEELAEQAGTLDLLLGSKS